MSKTLFSFLVPGALLFSACLVPAHAEPGLKGTAWKLVKIEYGDEKVHRPEDPTKYTLTFVDEKSVTARIDCNQGSGTWKSTEPSLLEFGPLATTRVMCPPGSLFNLVVRDLPNVRSYVIKDGKLYLSLFADGGIYEFHPLEKPARANDKAQGED